MTQPRRPGSIAAHRSLTSRPYSWLSAVTAAAVHGLGLGLLLVLPSWSPSLVDGVLQLLLSLCRGGLRYSG